jgi:hypothetical protein
LTRKKVKIRDPELPADKKARASTDRINCHRAPFLAAYAAKKFSSNQTEKFAMHMAWGIYFQVFNLGKPVLDIAEDAK